MTTLGERTLDSTEWSRKPLDTSRRETRRKQECLAAHHCPPCGTGLRFYLQSQLKDLNVSVAPRVIWISTWNSIGSNMTPDQAKEPLYISHFALRCGYVLLIHIWVKLLTSQAAVPQRIRTRTPAGYWQPRTWHLRAIIGQRNLFSCDHWWLFLDGSKGENRKNLCSVSWPDLENITKEL